MNTAQVVGTRRIEIERGHKLEVIDLQVKVYAAQVHRPKHFGSGSGLPNTIPIWGVEAQEVDTGQAQLIRWRLLCTERTESASEALRRLDDYVLRWRVERFHYTLKQGLKVERLQFDDARTVMNALSAYSLVAWRLMFITYYARLYPSRPCSEIVSVEEHRALSAKAKGSVQSVGEVVLEIAKLGGYRQSHAPPGVKVIWRGLYALQFLTMGFSLALSQKNMRQG
jgi:IS4 transposase